MNKFVFINIKKYLLVIICLIVLNGIIFFNVIKKERIKNDFFRIHVVANSDSISDQMIKLQVSQNIDNYLSSALLNEAALTKDEIKALVKENIPDILNIANSNCSSNYTVSAKMGNIHYDKKTKNNITMDEGVYDSLQIVLGEGNGQNWWSLVFPYSYEGYCCYLEDSNIESIDKTNNKLQDSLSTKDILNSDDIKFDSIILSYVKKLVDNF